MNVIKFILPSLAILYSCALFAENTPTTDKKSDADKKQAQAVKKPDATKTTGPKKISDNDRPDSEKKLVEELKQKHQAPLFKNIGTRSGHSIATNSPLAQIYFNQGLTFYYAFEWGESIRSFREAIRLDPDCAMCYWGLALALGSKANAPMDGHEYSDAKAAAQKAAALAQHGPVSETDYTRALALRFQHQPRPQGPGVFSCHTTGGDQDASSHQELTNYAQAMQKLVKQYPNDNDAKALYAFALLDSIDWQSWDADGKINPATPAVLQTLDTVLANSKRHVGANHYYVHVIEQSPQPEHGIPSAERLKDIVPASEHLVHMPTHIYFLTGRYHEATDANQKAIATYKNYSTTCRSQGFEPQITYLYHHDYDFLRTTATYEGRKQLALSAANDLIANLPKTWIEQNADLQGFIPVPYYVKARFGMWNELLKEPMPESKYSYAVGMWHYAKGMALVRTGQVKQAEDEAETLKKIVDKGPTPETLGKQGSSLLNIAYNVLGASIADANGKEKATFTYLETARKIQHDMGYHEPPDWYFPVTEALGDAYLKWNHPTEAAQMYEKVLSRYPRNPWALYGLTKALQQLNQAEKAKAVSAQFKKAWQFADIKEPISLFPAKEEAPVKPAEKKTS